MMFEFISASIIICFTVWYFYIHFKVSRRMGFSKHASYWIVFSALFGIAVIVWWYVKWPNEFSPANQDGAGA